MAMRAASDSPLLTADDVLELSYPGKVVELVRGRLVVKEPPSTRHGRAEANLSYFLAAFVRAHALGIVVSGAGFKITENPDTVRAPDVAFVPQERAAAIPERNYAAFAPILLAEIVSPNDRPGEVLAKVADWLDAGARIVWVVDPQRSVAQVYRGDGSVTFVAADGLLDGEDVLPGLRIALCDVLD
jgi:Uma2 family endonuclease